MSNAALRFLVIAALGAAALWPAHADSMLGARGPAPAGASHCPAPAGQPAASKAPPPPVVVTPVAAAPGQTVNVHCHAGTPSSRGPFELPAATQAVAGAASAVSVAASAAGGVQATSLEFEVKGVRVGLTTANPWLYWSSFALLVALVIAALAAVGVAASNAQGGSGMGWLWTAAALIIAVVAGYAGWSMAERDRSAEVTAQVVAMAHDINRQALSAAAQQLQLERQRNAQLEVQLAVLRSANVVRLDTPQGPLGRWGEPWLLLWLASMAGVYWVFAGRRDAAEVYELRRRVDLLLARERKTSE